MNFYKHSLTFHCINDSRTDFIKEGKRRKYSFRFVYLIKAYFSRICEAKNKTQKN